jgi:hypothetical protein
VAPRLRDGLRLTSRKLMQLSFCHLRPTIEHGSLRIPAEFREGWRTFEREIIAESTYT